jgi:hypothetical protein
MSHDILADAIFEKIESKLVHVSHANAAEFNGRFTRLENGLVTIHRGQQAVVAQLTAVDVDVHAQLNAKLDELKQQTRLMLRVFIATLVTLGVIVVAVSLPVFLHETQTVELGSEYCKWYHEIPWSETMPHHAMQHVLTWARCAADRLMPKCCRPGFSCQRDA